MWNPRDDDFYRGAQNALLLLGAGYTHKIPGKHKKNVAKYTASILALQNKTGSFSSIIQVHARMTQFLCEAYCMTGDPQLRESAQLAIDYLLSRQISKGGIAYAWGEDSLCRTDDTVHALWAICAAKLGGLDVGDGYKGAKTWLQLCTENKQDVAGMYFPDSFNLTEMRGQGPDNMAGGLLAATLLGLRSGDEILEQLIEANWKTYFNKQQQWPIDPYIMHQLGYAFFQYGGQKWRDWNSVYRDLIIAQFATGPLLHSKGLGPRAEALGDMYTTIESAGMLEIYYRYNRKTR